MENIIKQGDSTVILNGGDPLPGCPINWEEAKVIEEKMNEGKEEFAEPKWSFDCGFKLDFDGALVRVSSRFYPPKTHYGERWDGRVRIFLLGRELADEKKFDCETLEELKEQVEKYVREITDRITLA